MPKKNGPAPNTIGVMILQYFIIAVCVLFVVFYTVQWAYYCLKMSPVFKIREVVSQQSLAFIRSPTLDKLIGQSIFDVDLYTVQRHLQVEYPQIDQLRLFRQFPNRIYVDAIRRDPFAVVMVRRLPVLVDKDGIVLDLAAPQNHRLPMISGLVFEQNATVGKLIRHADMTLATGIIKAVHANPHLGAMPVVSLDMTNLSEIKCHLANGLRVIFTEENFQQKVMKLGIVMSQGKIQPQDVNYIDLRFKDPIINYKDKPGKI